MNYTFESLFAQRLYEFIQQKNAVGFPYAESTRLLSEFDRFCLEQFPNEATLTKEICLAWAIRRDTEGNNTFRNRLLDCSQIALSVAVQNVPLKAAQGKVVEYLSEHALESLLKQPNPVKRTELRNLFFMVLM